MDPVNLAEELPPSAFDPIRLWFAIRVYAEHPAIGISVGIILICVLTVVAVRKLPYRKLGFAQAVKERRIAARARALARQQLPPGKSTKLRCNHCQHVQTVPLGESTFVCEQCDAHLF